MRNYKFMRMTRKETKRISLSRHSHSYSHFSHRSKGFSIVETIVAIAILSVAIVAPMTLAQRGLSSAVYARDQITAFYLAQEAIEFVRNTRDNKNYAGRSGSSDWLLGNSCIAPSTCGVDVSNPLEPAIIDCNLKSCLLTFDASSGTYGSGPGSNTIYTRTFQIQPFVVNSGAGAAADLTATVTWKSGRISKSLTVTEKIFDWYPPPAP